MRLPRDLSGIELARALATLGYRIDHQTGSHIRLATEVNGEHHVTVPAHDEIRIGTLAAILRDIANHHGIAREDLLEKLF